VRIVPAFIDIAIFLSQLVILGSFFYVAYIWGNLNRAIDCRADINTDSPLEPGIPQTGANVSEHFRIAIRWGFWMSLLTFTRAILA